MNQRTWAVIAAFFDSPDAQWLDDFVEDERLRFRKIPAPLQNKNWHQKTARKTRVLAWVGHLRQARAAFATKPDGILCAFPQLTITAAVLRKLSRRKPVIVGYNFNLGGFPGGLRQKLVRWVAREVAFYVVHSPIEVERYAQYLGLDQDRVRFIPLQRGVIHQIRQQVDPPYIVAMGSAGRDYPTLIKAVDHLKIPTWIITRKADIGGFPESGVVKYFSDLGMDDCLDILAGARISVTPVANLTTASGQITFINALQLGVPSIVTECPGVHGYIVHESNGLLVKPGSIDDMINAIERLWCDDALQTRLMRQGQDDARTKFSDEAVGKILQQLIQEASQGIQTEGR